MSKGLKAVGQQRCESGGRAFQAEGIGSERPCGKGLPGMGVGVKSKGAGFNGDE